MGSVLLKALFLFFDRSLSFFCFSGGNVSRTICFILHRMRFSLHLPPAKLRCTDAYGKGVPVLLDVFPDVTFPPTHLGCSQGLYSHSWDPSGQIPESQDTRFLFYKISHADWWPEWFWCSAQNSRMGPKINHEVRKDSEKSPSAAHTYPFCLIIRQHRWTQLQDHFTTSIK